MRESDSRLSKRDRILDEGEHLFFDGDYEGAARLVREKGVIGEQLQAELDRLTAKGIPVDIVFEQGVDVLGL